MIWFPGYVKRFTVAYYLQSLVPHAMPSEGATSILQAFFHKCLADFEDPGLNPLGQQIITCCLDSGKLEDYEQLIPAG